VTCRFTFIAAVLIWLPGAVAFAQTPTINLGRIAEANVDGLKQRAQAGDLAAQFELGIRYHEGRGVPQDYIEAMQWFRMGADQGDADSEFNLAVMYEKGRGVLPNLEDALRWYQKAALQDFAPAEYNLGVLFDKARGVPLDYTEAMRWYRKAADQSYAPAQYNLGLLYYYGQGTPVNLVQAHMWVGLAALKATGEDRKKFTGMFDEMASAMTRQQILDAERLTEAWLPPAK
jgi:hypothetical protein